MRKKKCPICGRVISSQGYGGHMWGVHGVKVGEKANIEERLNRIEQKVDTLNEVVLKLTKS